MKQKILILYFSGTGATKKIAELMHSYLISRQAYHVAIESMENFKEIRFDEYHAFIIGTPVYHGAPSRVVSGCLKRMPPLKKAAPVFIYNTRALYSCNTNRMVADQLQDKNMVTIEDREYRGPASDGVLLAPFIRRFFKFEPNLKLKIKSDCDEFLRLLGSSQLHGYRPRFRLISILNASNQFAGQLLTFRIYLHRDKCIRCGSCIRNCPHRAWEESREGYPLFSCKKCENCFRCIHHCPAKALSLSKHVTPKKVLSFDSGCSPQKESEH